jgi:hypothetical protein
VARLNDKEKRAYPEEKLDTQSGKRNSGAPITRCAVGDLELSMSCLSWVRRERAPRHAMLDTWCSQERFGGRPLGHLIHLQAKARGDKSMSEKREAPEGADGAVLQGPCDRAKAALLEPQSPGVEPHTHRHSA